MDGLKVFPEWQEKQFVLSPVWVEGVWWQLTQEVDSPVYTPPEWQLEQASDPCAAVNGNPVWLTPAEPNPLVEWHEPQLPGFGIG